MAEPTPPAKQIPPANESIIASALDEYGVRDLTVEYQPRYQVVLQDPKVQRWLPISTSLVIPLLILMVGILTYKAYTMYTDKSEKQQIIPEAAYEGMGEPGGIPHPGLGGDPTRDAAQDIYKDIASNSEGWASRPSASLQETLAGGGSGETSEGDSAIALGPNVGFGSGGGQGSGSGEGVGGGSGSGGGPLAPFGVPGGGGGLGPRAAFMGMGGAGRNIMFLCDASGSMMGDSFDLLKVELEKAITALRPVQGFNVVFFRESGYEAIFSDGLQLANTENKEKAIAFLKTVATGLNSDCRPGLQFAFRHKPNLIYLLTDGVFVVRDENNASRDISREVQDLIRKLNPDTKVRINTIAYVRKEQEDGEKLAVESMLRAIAANNAGMFKLVTVDQLMRGSY